MAELYEKSVSFEGINLAYSSTQGSVDVESQNQLTLCFIHGWCCARTLWVGQAALYSAHRSLLIDLPGHGDSDKPEHMDYSVDLHARAVRYVLSVEKADKVVLIGHSMGGNIATMVLRMLGEQTIKGIVYLSSFWMMPAHYMTAENRALWKEALKDDESFFSYFTARWTEKSTPAIRRLVQETMVSRTPSHVRLDGCTDSLPPHWLWKETFALPTLHITYSGADEWDPQHKHHLTSHVTEEIDGVSVFVHMEEADKVNQRVERFLKDHGLN